MTLLIGKDGNARVQAVDKGGLLYGLLIRAAFTNEQKTAWHMESSWCERPVHFNPAPGLARLIAQFACQDGPER